MKPKITLSKNKPTYPDPWYTSWKVGPQHYFSWYDEGDEQFIEVNSHQTISTLRRIFTVAGYEEKPEGPWFSFTLEQDGCYAFTWYKDGKEVTISTSMHGVTELRLEFLANGYTWR